MRNSVYLSRSATQFPDDAISGEPRNRPTDETGFFSILRAEIGRAFAATRRYETLRYARSRDAGHAPADLPRKIFGEFYAAQEDTGQAPRAPQRSRPRLLADD
jgi:hypothetical protein